jgi:hypothetical protein
LIKKLDSRVYKIDILKSLTSNDLEIDFFVDFLQQKKDELKLLNEPLNNFILSDYEKMAKIFSIGYINYSLNYDILKNLKDYMENKNKTLEDQNVILLDVVNDLIKLNYDLGSNSNNPYGSFRKSTIELCIEDSKPIEDKLLNNLKKIKYSINGRVAKFVTKRNLNLLKNMSTDLKKSFIATRRASVNRDYCIELLDSNKKADILQTEISIRRNKRFYTQVGKVSPSINESASPENKLLIENNFNKLYMLQENVIRSIKENENIKSFYNSLKEDIHKIIKTTDIKIKNEAKLLPDK